MKILWGHSRKTLVLQRGLRGNLVKEMGIEAELGKLKGAVRAHRVSQERMQRTALPLGLWSSLKTSELGIHVCVTGWDQHAVEKEGDTLKVFPHLYHLHSYWTCPKLACHHRNLLTSWAFSWQVKAPSSLGWAPTLARQHLQLLDSCLTSSQQGQSGDENINDFLSLMQSENRYSSDIATFSSKRHSFSRYTVFYDLQRQNLFDSCHMIFPSHFRGKDIEGLIC